jgi:hypothetical protein
MNRRAYLLVGLVGLVVGAAEYVLHYRGLAFPDALDYAQMARQTAWGRPFETLIARPLTVAAAHDPFVEISRPPLHPLSLGLWFSVAGPGEFQAAAFSAVMWLAAGLALYACARRFLDTGPAALAAVLFFLTPSLLPYVWSGMSEAPFILLLVLAFWQLCGPPDGTRHALIGGLLLAGACLVRGIGILAIPWALVAGWSASARTARQRVSLVAGLTAPLLIWAISRRIVGAPAPLSFNLAELPMFTETYPRYSLFRMATPIDPIAFVLARPGEVVDKFARGLKVYGVEALRLLPIPATLAWLAAVTIPKRDGRFRALKWAILGLLLTHVVVLPLYEPTPRFLLPLVPLLLLLGASAVARIACARTRGAVVAAWVTLFVASLHGWARRPPARPERFTPKEATALRNALDTNTVVITDAPWRTAWELGLRSVWIPQDQAGLRRVEQRLGDVGGFLLTPGLSAMEPSERPNFWMSVWEGTAWPQGYQQTGAGLEPGLVIGRRPEGGRAP